MEPMQAIEVGNRHPTLRVPVPEGAFFNWTAGALELLLSFRSPTAKEVEGVRIGESEFALATEPPAVWLLYRFTGGLPWGDVPYTIHVLPEDQRPDLILFTTSAQRLALQAILVDAATAEVKVLRLVTLSPEFSRALTEAVQAQAASAWKGREEYDRQLAAVYQRFPSTTDLLRVARHRTKGGA